MWILDPWLLYIGSMLLKVNENLHEFEELHIDR